MQKNTIYSIFHLTTAQHMVYNILTAILGAYFAKNTRHVGFSCGDGHGVFALPTGKNTISKRPIGRKNGNENPFLFEGDFTELNDSFYLL